MRGLMRSGLVVKVALVAMVCLGGCLVAHNQKEVRTGRWVPESTFDQIKVGETSADWVKATLGDPSEKTRVDDKSEIWRWNYNVEESKEGYVFLIFAGSNKKETPGSAYVELKDGVVARKWRS